MLLDFKFTTKLFIDTSAPLPDQRMQEAWENEIWVKSLLTELRFPNTDWLIVDWLIDFFTCYYLASNTTKPKTDAKKEKQGKESKTEGKNGDKPQGEKAKEESKPKDGEKKQTEKSEKPKEPKEKQDKDGKKDSDTEEPLPLPSAEEASSNEPAGSSSSSVDSSKEREHSSDSSSKKQANDELW